MRPRRLHLLVGNTLLGVVGRGRDFPACFALTIKLDEENHEYAPVVQLWQQVARDSRTGKGVLAVSGFAAPAREITCGSCRSVAKDASVISFCDPYRVIERVVSPEARSVNCA